MAAHRVLVADPAGAAGCCCGVLMPGEERGGDGDVLLPQLREEHQVGVGARELAAGHRRHPDRGQGAPQKGEGAQGSRG